MSSTSTEGTKQWDKAFNIDESLYEKSELKIKKIKCLACGRGCINKNG